MDTISVSGITQWHTATHHAWSSHPQQSMWCWMKRIAVFIVKNQDTLHDIVLTLGATYAMNSHIIMECPTQNTSFQNTSDASYKAHKGHHARSSLRHYWEDQDRWSSVQITVPQMKDITAWDIAICTEVALDHQHQDRCSHHRNSSWWSHSAHRGHSHRPHHDTLHSVTLEIIHTSQLFRLLILRLHSRSHSHDHPTALQGMNHADQVHTPAGQEEGYTPRRTWRWR